MLRVVFDIIYVGICTVYFSWSYARPFSTAASAFNIEDPAAPMTAES
jgi:hypothetical protein